MGPTLTTSKEPKKSQKMRLLMISVKFKFHREKGAKKIKDGNDDLIETIDSNVAVELIRSRLRNSDVG